MPDYERTLIIQEPKGPDFHCEICIHNNPETNFGTDDPPYCIFCAEGFCMSCMYNEWKKNKFFTCPDYIEKT